MFGGRVAISCVAMSTPLDFGGTTAGVTTKTSGYSLRSQKIFIQILEGPDAGQDVVLPGPRARLGSSADCELCLSDPTVSREHLQVRVDKDSVRVTDLGSRNGTTVDGLQIFDAIARPDSLLGLGNTTMRLRLLSDVIELPLSSSTQFGSLLGSSVAMRQLFSILERVSPTDTTVLIEGETGTGKELIAEAIHDASPRASGPFIVFDCSAVSPQLMESELFGHVRGAFTGAVADRVGSFEAANGGTLFLDEVGELPLELQPKLLRALERLEVRRVGTHETRKMNVRIVSATNRSLSNEVERGTFREDLYYRLAVVRVTAPPLRERPDDIPILTNHFFTQLGGGPNALPEQTIRAFQSMAWPGNIRELRNAVARALSIGAPRDLGGQPASPAATWGSISIDIKKPLKIAKEELCDQFEKAYIIELLNTAEGNITRAAAIAGVNRKYIHRALHRHGLRG